VHVFCLRGPPVREGEFHADADGPAVLPIGRPSDLFATNDARFRKGRRPRCRDISICPAAFGVEQGPAPGVSEPGCQSSQGAYIVFAIVQERLDWAGCRPTGIRSAGIRFNAPDELSSLEVVTGLAAEKVPRIVGVNSIALSRPMRVPPGAADREACIRAAPVRGGHPSWGPLRDRRHASPQRGRYPQTGSAARR
jgi:hypothetical protein